MSLRENWTKDADGNYVDWTKPPYRVAGSGRLRLVLENEDDRSIPTDIQIKRIQEYYAITRRDMRRGSGAE